MLQSKKILSLILIFTTVLVMMAPVAAKASANFTDLHDSWAKDAIIDAVANGLLVGSGDKIMPDKELTRAEMAAILTRAFGATEKADISKYSDISPDSWYAGDMAKAIKMGAFYSYDGKVYPDKPMTREEAFTVLGNVLRSGTIDYSALGNFSDKSEISSWALLQIAALAKAGYINGNGGKLNPHSIITRAEIAQVMDNIFKRYIKEPGTYTSVPDGSVMINVSGVTLKDVTVNGDLIIGDGVGTGHCELDAVTLKGRLIVRGSGEHTTVAGIASADGEENTVTLLHDADGGTGQIVITNSVGSVVLNTADNTVQLFSGSNAPPAPVILPPNAISALYEALPSRPTPPAPPPAPIQAAPTPVTGQMPSPSQQAEQILQSVLGDLQPAPSLGPAQSGLPPAPSPSDLTDGTALVICNPNNNTRVLGTGTDMPPAVCEPGSRLSGDFANVVVSGTSSAAVSTQAPPSTGSTDATPTQLQQPDVQISGNVQNTFVASPSQVAFGSGSFQNLIVGSEAQGTSVTTQSDAIVQTVSANAQATITGTGTVHDVQANADNITVSTPGTHVTAVQGVSGVMAGGIPVAAGESVTVNAPTSTSSSHRGTPPALSSNANLQSLEISSGTSDISFSPSFSPGVTYYSASISSTAGAITLTAVTADSNATVRLLIGDVVTSSSITMSPGINAVTVAVYAQDGTEIKYTINITREAPKPVSAELIFIDTDELALRIQMDGPLTNTDVDPVAFTITCESLDPLSGKPLTATLGSVSISGSEVIIPFSAYSLPISVSYNPTRTNGSEVSAFELPIRYPDILQ